MTIPARFLFSLLVFAAAGGAAHAQFDQATSKALLEEYSLQLFGNNATGYMGPLVVVSNVGAHHGFFHSAKMSKKDELRFEISIPVSYTHLTLPTSDLV